MRRDQSSTLRPNLVPKDNAILLCDPIPEHEFTTGLLKESPWVPEDQVLIVAVLGENMGNGFACIRGLCNACCD